MLLWASWCIIRKTLSGLKREIDQQWSDLMNQHSWNERILCDPAVHHGEPCIRGTRIAVSVIVASLADTSIEGLLGQYSQLTREDIQAALYYAADAARSSLVA